MNSLRPYGVPQPRVNTNTLRPIDPKAILRSRITRRNSQHQQMLAMQTAQVAMAQSAAQVNQTNNMSNAYQQSQGQQRSSEVNPTTSTSDVTRSNQNQNYFGNPIQIRGPIRAQPVQAGPGGGPPTGPTGQIMIKMEPSWEEYNHTNNHAVVSQPQSQPQQTINVGPMSQHLGLHDMTKKCMLRTKNGNFVFSKLDPPDKGHKGIIQ